MNAKNPKKKERPMDKASSKSILVVDDEPDIRNFLSTCIQDAGFQVDEAVDGQDALEKIENGNYDLMTLDMVMPRKSGIELIRVLRKDEKWSKLPIIVITAHARNEFASEDIKSFNAFTSGLKPRRTIEKPVTPDVLVQTICDILDVRPEEPVSVEKTDDHNISMDEKRLLQMIREGDTKVIDRIKNLLDAS